MSATSLTQAADTPQAEILKWKDGKTGVFLLEFDDSCPSHLDKAIPELVKRDLVGTFYINPGNGQHTGRAKGWEKAASIPQVVLGNHTFKHKGAPDLETIDEDMRLGNEAIAKLLPGLPARRFVSFGQPGGVPWKITKEEFAALRAKYNLIDRPPFAGYPFQYHSEAEVLALVDQALAKGEMRHHDFHGVGGDWHVTPLDIYTNLLDKLVANRDKLWVTDPVSYHKYKTEREAAKVTVVSASAGKIVLALDIATDPEFYDLPLSVSVSLPGGNTVRAEIAPKSGEVEIAVKN
jgi:hypothetical protein